MMCLRSRRVENVCIHVGNLIVTIRIIVYTRGLAKPLVLGGQDKQFSLFSEFFLNF